ncbi:MAG: YHYH protein [Actinomycetota bacterium]|nr:YHYH protein [Actinomycetota bacterium]
MLDKNLQRNKTGLKLGVITSGLAVVLASCGSSGSALSSAGSSSASSQGSQLPSATTTSGSSTSSAVTAGSSTPQSSSSTATTALNPQPVSGSFPLGDGKVLYGSAAVGYVDSCGLNNTNTRKVHGGPWINTANNTWTPSAKVVVQGNNYYPSAYFHMSVANGIRTVATDSVPVGMPVGTYPISPNDPAYQYGKNPNHIIPNALSITLPASPVVASSPSCLPQGPIGVLTNGVLLFNALDAGALDAAAHEVQDVCGGHPDAFGTYHYHNISPCILNNTKGSSTLVGYALDGFGIYVERNSDGSLVTNSQLDQCHGRISPVEWDGKVVDMYHYDATNEYPYTLGCFAGTVTSAAASSIGDAPNTLVQKQG